MTFCLRTKEGRCTDFRDTAEKVQTGFKMYLNVAPTVTSWSSANDEFSLVFEANPLGEFVELPDNYNALKYSNILCGAIRSVAEMSLLLDVTKIHLQRRPGDGSFRGWGLVCPGQFER